MLAATGLTIIRVAGWLHAVERTDFASFYASIQAWRPAGALYDPAQPAVNLNPPHLSILLFGPLLPFSLRTAAILWAALQIGAGALAITVIQRELHLRARHVLWLVAILLLSVAASQQFREGQVGGMLLLLSTLAWRAARRQSHAWWIVLSASMKPWIAVWLLALPPRQVLRGACAGLLGVAAGIALLGAENWRMWLALTGRFTAGIMSPAGIRAEWSFINVSILSTGAHLVAAVWDANTASQAAEQIWLAGSIIVGALTLRTMRHASPDLRLLVYGVAGILISPIAWAYYLPILTGPLVAYGQRMRWPRPLIAAVALLCVPTTFVPMASQIGVVLLLAVPAWLERQDANERRVTAAPA